VPFSLLNLTLDTPIGKTSTPYFPCQSYNPSDGNPYILGRASLQAAFIGRNWNRQISWLGQAPGPGVLKNGLGNVMLDIEETNLGLPDIFTNSRLFIQGWERCWTLLPDPEGSAVSSTPKSSTTDATKVQTSLSTGVKAGIGIGVTAVILLAVGIFCLFLRHQHRKGPNDLPPEFQHVHECKRQTAALEHTVNKIPGPQDCYTYELATPTPQLDSTPTPR